MTRSTRTLTLLLAMVLLLPFAAHAEADDRAALAHLLETFLAGASVNNAAVHERFWAEDLVYTSSDGRRFGKETIMASLSEAQQEDDEAQPTLPAYAARDINIRVFGETAVVTFRLVAQRGGEAIGEYFNTGVFRRRDPGWQAVTWQATRAASMAQESTSGDQG